MRWIFFFVSLVILIPLVIYFINFHGAISNLPEHWESFGSYFGGISGSLLGFISTLLVVWTFENQMKDSKIKNQQDTFFKLLEMLNHTISEIRHVRKRSGVISNGEAALKYIYSDWLEALTNLREDNDEITKENLKVEYKKFFKKHRNGLGHYFRLLYNIVKYIDHSNLDIDEKRQYVGFLKSKLSQLQLQLIFYNCLVGQGEEKFKPLIEKYRLFDNLEMDGQPTISLFKESFNNTAYQNNHG